MKTYFLPKTSLGKWSVWLIVASILFIVVFQILRISGQERGETFFDNLPFSITGLLIIICGFSSFITGLIGVITRKERSALVFLAAIIGLLFSVFVIVMNIVPQ